METRVLEGVFKSEEQHIPKLWHLDCHYRKSRARQDHPPSPGDVHKSTTRHAASRLHGNAPCLFPDLTFTLSLTPPDIPSVPSEPTCRRLAQAPEGDSYVESHSPVLGTLTLWAECSLGSTFIKCCLGLCVQDLQRREGLPGAKL